MSTLQHRRALALSTLFTMATTLAAPRPASAFCGFYVSGGDTRLTNDATMVVLMREGQRTVLSMQNNYKGPPSDFAMVVPVPVVLQKENVRTLPREVFDRVDLMASPRLVEYWEQDPCPTERARDDKARPAPPAAAPKSAAKAEAQDNLGVRVEAEFTVGEYEVVVLSAQDSGGLDTWLRQNRYQIPAGAEPALRPYVAKGMKFFVAKVNAGKVKFEKGEAVLSPLRFHYDADDFSLPVRLGMLNSDGKQELVVHILARGKRYDVVNYPNVTIPTNYDVSEEARERFGPFYAALFDATMEKHPGAVVTEYAWDASTCDPCPGPSLGPGDMVTLGADALHSTQPPPNLATDPSLRPVLKTEGLPAIRPDPRGPFNRSLENTLLNCYTAELATIARARGRVEVTPLPGDRQTEVTTRRSGTLSPTLEACVARAARNARRQTGDGKYTISFDTEPGAPGQGWWKAPPVNGWGFTLTRLHTRYAKDGLGQDLIFREAAPIVGGREDHAQSEQDHGAKPGTVNNFQARYAIRHPWTGPITCADPKRGVWGGPPAGTPGDMRPKAASKIAYVPRGQVSLASLLKQAVPDLGLHPTEAKAPLGARGTCGCSVPDAGNPFLPGALFAGAALLWRARRARRKRP